MHDLLAVVVLVALDVVDTAVVVAVDCWAVCLRVVGCVLN